MSDRRKQVLGTVYIMHFDRPLNGIGGFRDAQHYIGWTDDVEARAKRHFDGRGARIVAAFAERGIGYTIVKTFDGTREDERRIKRAGHTERHCHICKEAKKQ